MESIQVYKTVSRGLIPDVSEIVCQYLYKRRRNVMYFLREVDYSGQSTHTADIGFYSVKEDAIDHLLKSVIMCKDDILDREIRDRFEKSNHYDYDPGRCDYYIIEKDLSTSNKRRRLV